MYPRRLFPLLLIAIMVVGVALADTLTERRAALRALAEKAEGGDAAALYHLATLHDTGYDSIEVDSARSTLLYRLSAEKGYAPAMNYLGFRYFNGEYVAQDVDSALYWMAKAAGAGDAKAANNLGFLLANSDKVARDYHQAFYWLSRAAQAGLPAGESQLADLYRNGLGTEKDTAKAEVLYNRAIAGGLRDAELKLLSMKGRDWETLPPDSALMLGRYYYSHNAPFIGVTLFENAAAYDNADALALLGDAYSRGVGVEYNHHRSLEYFLRAALLGQPSAEFVVGELLDIFPDALSDSVAQTVIKRYMPHSSPQEAARNDSAGIASAQYWYDKASGAGITDAEGASRRLLAPEGK